MLSIKTLLAKTPIGEPLCIQGWVKTKRISKRVVFLTLYDGSCAISLQVVAEVGHFPEELFKDITTGTCLAVEGKLVASPGKGQSKELEAHKIDILGKALETYPLQPKHHTLAFLRSMQHLRMRTNTFGAIFRIRHAVSLAIHTFFNERSFYWLHTPIITGVDAEGAGEVFAVATRDEQGKLVDHDFFGQSVSLTVSGQLAGEVGAMGLGKIYTFGPTFRAENSNTTRHLSEFWMVEPEMAFYDLSATVDLAEALIKYVANYLLMHCNLEITFLEKLEIAKEVEKQAASVRHQSMPLRDRLRKVVDNQFVRITYTEAINLLIGAMKKDVSLFKNKVIWGEDLQKEHEQYLTHYFQEVVVVTDYPKELKAFYMYQNSDEKTVAAMDILFPGIGEVVGGSQREDRLDYLERAMEAKGIKRDLMEWYLDTRRFGSFPHSGFGLGFERFMLFVTGMENIRDVIPFPRTPGHAMC